MSDNKNFLDPKMITTLVLIAGFWMAWSYYMDVKYPHKDVPAISQSATTSTSQPGIARDTETPTKVGSADTPAVIETPDKVNAENLTEYSSPEFSFQISSLGMGIKNIDIKKYRSREDQPIVLGQVKSELPFSTYSIALDRPIQFKIEATDANSFRGIGQANGTEITKTFKVHPETYSLEVEVTAKNLTEEFKGLVTYISDLLVDQKKSGFLSPPIEKQEVYFLHDDKQTRQALSSDKDYIKEDSNVKLLAIDIHYFALALAENSALSPSTLTGSRAVIRPSKIQVLSKPEAKSAGAFELTGGREVYIGSVQDDYQQVTLINGMTGWVLKQNLEPLRIASAALIYPKSSLSSEMKINYTAFAGPKSFDILTKVDERLGSVVDYGTFAVIARPLLTVMKFFNGLVHNYGFAIILLTLLVRALVMPFNIYSFKSMKVMQKLQPEMKALREKFKADPVQQNAKVMELMKTNKANPLGGCLPMLLQLPVFFALYQTLGQSIELYREPFIFWIHDLSFRDPYFVLPVLMGITMFIQQKITPSNMDPQQAKIMMFMPIMFTFFMVSLPSGLTLYIFISTLFGITQQYLFLREKTPNHTQVKQVQA